MGNGLAQNGTESYLFKNALCETLPGCVGPPWRGGESDGLAALARSGFAGYGNCQAISLARRDGLPHTISRCVDRLLLVH